MSQNSPNFLVPKGQRNQKDQTQNLNPLNLFQKDAVDDGLVFEKAEVLLDTDLAFVQGKQFRGRPPVGKPRPIWGNDYWLTAIVSQETIVESSISLLSG